MPLARCKDSVLIVVDMQEKFLAPIVNKGQVINRCKFMIEVANLLMVPVLATVQYSERMGGTIPEIAEMIKTAHNKMPFSCCGSDDFLSELNTLGRSQVVLVGIETHICVNQTAHHLLELGKEVFVVADACGSRGSGHDIGIPRLRHAGVTVAHSESVVYEWLESAENPQFKAALDIVKKYSSNNA